MKIKTCEEYVIEQLIKAEEKVAELQAQSESLYQDWCELEKSHKELSDKYDTLCKALYEIFIEVANDEWPYLTFKNNSLLFDDDPNYSVIKEAIDSWARRIEVPVEEAKEGKK